MPELVEVEAYRRLAEGVVGRTVAEVVAPDAWYLKRGLDAATAEAVLTGATVTGTRRIGKLLLLDLDGDRPVLGLRFGMSGRLVVDGHAGVDELIYSPRLPLDKWDRFGLRFDGRRRPAHAGPPPAGRRRARPARGPAGARRPRRHAGRRWPPPSATAGARRRSRPGSWTSPASPGVGNLAADEILWRAGLDPARPAGGLSANELRRLHRHLRGTMADLMARGGSHAGDLMAERRVGGVCPKDGTPLVRRTVGGRTTFSCPKHQV